MKDITQNLLNELFVYKDGNLFNKIKRGKADVGAKVGGINSNGRVRVVINNKIYQAHRLIFLMHHGYLPKYIDHIDGNPLNNRIENLRQSTLTENQCNQRLRKDNDSGCKNVSWKKSTNKWFVQLMVNRKKISVGYFDDLELADLAATLAREKYHGEFANHGGVNVK